MKKADLGYLSSYIRDFRKDRELSLDQLAEQSGVSRSMICQIEKGNATPTINVLWKLAEAMQTPISVLVDPCSQKSKFQFRQKNELPTIVSDDGSFTAVNLTQGSCNRNVEVIQFEFSKPGKQPVAAFASVVTQYLVLDKGELTIEVPDQQFDLKQGMSLEYQLTARHVLVQKSSKLARGTIVRHYR